MNNYDYKYLTPFKWFILENFPFIEEDFDALTNWQLFCKLGKEINKIIKNVNLTGEQVENLTNAFNELKNYVNTYFENLDVQDEINNKLDEMAEDGTLQEIITSYLQISGILAFNTVQDMKEATNLINGSFVKTLGYYEANDGGSATYKIRTVTNQDTEDDAFIIALNNSNLVAELIIDNVNVKQLGAKGDGITDDYNSFNKAIIKNLNYINIPKGTFLINSPLNVDNCKVIKGYSQNNTVIKAPNGFLTWQNNKDYRMIKNLTIDGLEINNNTAISGVLEIGKIENVKITNFDTAINTIQGTWMNSFENILINYCNNGFIHTGDAFNNNSFINCYFQHINNYCCNIAGYNIKFLECNFENSKYCFHNGCRLLEIDNCYIEGNERVFNIDGAFYQNMVNIHDCWLTPISNPENGWLMMINTFSNVDAETASYIFSNNWIDNKIKDTIKPFSFTNNGNKTYCGVSLFKNYYLNIKSGYSIYYDDLFDRTNCPSYGMPGNPVTFSSDLPLFKYDNIEWYKIDKGNIKGATNSQRKIQMVGHYEIESSGRSSIQITPDKKYGNMYPQLNNLPVIVQYNDNTFEICRMSIDNSNFYVYVNSSKTTSRIIFNNIYYQGY